MRGARPAHVPFFGFFRPRLEAWDESLAGNMNFNLTLLPGDGIGPEVVGEAVRVLEVIASQHGHAFSFTERLIGGCSIDKFGCSLTDETLADCKAADAVLLGAVGGPKWDDPSAKDRPERGLLALRKGLAVFANLRPVKVHPALIELLAPQARKAAGRGPAGSP